MKHADAQSLRFLVDKWLAPPASARVRVTAFGRTRHGRRRFAQVETRCGEIARRLFFFRHDDGRWCVFPPSDEADRQAHAHAHVPGEAYACASD